jgi:predicted transcriptional regulator
MTEQPAKPKRHRPNPQIGIVIDPGVKLRLEKLASDQDRSLSYISKQALLEYLNKHGY